MDNGHLIRQIRRLFLESKQRVDTFKIAFFVTDYVMSKKTGQPEAQTKEDVWGIVKILATTVDADVWALKKILSTKHL